jgi:hypothetical protein
LNSLLQLAALYPGFPSSVAAYAFVDRHVPMSAKRQQQKYGDQNVCAK